MEGKSLGFLVDSLNVSKEEQVIHLHLVVSVQVSPHEKIAVFVGDPILDQLVEDPEELGLGDVPEVEFVEIREVLFEFNSLDPDHLGEVQKEIIVELLLAGSEDVVVEGLGEHIFLFTFVSIHFVQLLDELLVVDVVSIGPVDLTDLPDFRLVHFHWSVEEEFDELGLWHLRSFQFVQRLEVGLEFHSGSPEKRLELLQLLVREEDVSPNHVFHWLHGYFKFKSI